MFCVLKSSHISASLLNHSLCEFSWSLVVILYSEWSHGCLYQANHRSLLIYIDMVETHTCSVSYMDLYSIVCPEFSSQLRHVYPSGSAALMTKWCLEWQKRCRWWEVKYVLQKVTSIHSAMPLRVPRGSSMVFGHVCNLFWLIENLYNPKTIHFLNKQQCKATNGGQH